MAVAGPYSPAVTAGNLIFVSGQIPMDAEGNIPESIEEQTKMVLDNLTEVLESADSSMKNVVRTTVFLTDINDFAIVNDIYAKYFSELYPARTCIEAAKLPKKVSIMIDAIAFTD